MTQGEQARALEAAALSERHKAEARQSAARVALVRIYCTERPAFARPSHDDHLSQVEGEMRQLATAMKQQKSASAAKVQQLASVVQDLQEL